LCLTSDVPIVNIVTVAEWESQAAIDAARAVVMKAHAQSGFNAQEAITRLGIEADIANCRGIAPADAPDLLQQASPAPEGG